MTVPEAEPSGLRVVWSQPGYRRLWAARTSSQWGDVFNTVALSLLVLQLTDSGLGVTGVVVAEIVPILLLAPVAGTLVDKMSPVVVMVTADLARAVLAALLIVASGDVWAIYAIAACMATASAFFAPAAGAALPALVSGDKLVAANSGIWVAAVVSQIALAPLAGLLVLAAGWEWAFAVNAASYVVSAAVLTRLRLAPAGAMPIRSRWGSGMLGGATAIAGDRSLRVLAAGQLLAALSAGATSALLVVLAKDSLRLDAQGYGFMLAAIGVGAVVGPVLVNRATQGVATPALVFGPFLLRGVVDIVLATVTAVPIALSALVAYGVGTSAGAVTFTSFLQAQTPAAVRGRVLAGFDSLWQFGRLISLILGGIAADQFGVRAVYAIGGILLIAAAGVGWRGLRSPAGG